MNDTTITGPLEALLLMATEPMGAAELAQALDVPTPVVWEALEDLATFYDETGRGFELRQVGEGWRYYTRPEHHEVIAHWVLEGQQSRLSQAALETLAVVAYLQPISRSRVGSIRGVNVDGVMRTLATRGLIEEAGHSEETGAMLWRTSPLFLEKMGFTTLDQLPPIAPHLPEASLLEAELAGLAETPVAREDGDMSENTEIPTADQAAEWAEAEASENAEAAQPTIDADEVPDQADLDRLSEPS
ncbi:SMC-Scp complex subunit ScpB [Propioniciclava sp. MC1683]|uniref:SMC-Scp complex subunit ScpB n=1 Tax=Propioniciclava sp. MC1683 TaxID=2760309 RepID=UPI0015FEF15D|nr:SMC-Scp complex subunit ScpB [Propioniciclava sp. MC1683]MBB1500429.1 SMC-Scp complex subunit ScpB [Propioniciclava sp. MC1683]